MSSEVCFADPCMYFLISLITSICISISGSGDIMLAMFFLKIDARVT